LLAVSVPLILIVIHIKSRHVTVKNNLAAETKLKFKCRHNVYVGKHTVQMTSYIKREQYLMS